MMPTPSLPNFFSIASKTMGGRGGEGERVGSKEEVYDDKSIGGEKEKGERGEGERV